MPYISITIKSRLWVIHIRVALTWVYIYKSSNDQTHEKGRDHLGTLVFKKKDLQLNYFMLVGFLIGF